MKPCPMWRLAFALSIGLCLLACQPLATAPAPVAIASESAITSELPTIAAPLSPAAVTPRPSPAGTLAAPSPWPTRPVIVQEAEWHSYGDQNDIRLLAGHPDGSLWAASKGGLIRWDLLDGSNTVFGSPQGLASQNVTALLIASNGDVWAGTDVGLSRYDGTRWVTYTHEDGLAEGAVITLMQSHDGTLWCSTEGGLASLSGETWQTRWTPDLGSTAVVRVAVETRDGALWFAAEDGGVLYTSDPGGSLKPVEGGPPSATHLLQDALGTLWAATSDGHLWHLDGTWAAVPSEPQGTLTALAAGNTDELWVAWADAVGRLSENDWNLFSGQDGLPAGGCAVLTPGYDGQIWCASKSELAHYGGQSWDAIRLPEFATASEIHTLYPDQAHGLFVGTSQGILLRTAESWSSYTTADPAIGVPSDMVEAPDGSLWLALGPGGMLRYAEERWHTYAAPKDANGSVFPIEHLFSPGDGTIWAAGPGYLAQLDPASGDVLYHSQCLADPFQRPIGQTADGSVWLCSAQGLTAVTLTGAWQPLETGEPSLPAEPTVLLEASDGTLWLGTQAGLYYAQGHPPAMPWKLTSGLRSQAVRALAEGPEGTIWVGFPSGLARFDGTRWQVLTTRDGLPANDVRALLAARDGTLWVGTASGLAHLSDQGWEKHTVEDGLPGPVVTALVEALDGSLWVGTEDGLARLGTDGWTTVDTLAINSAAAAPDGSLWFATERGVRRYDSLGGYALETGDLPSVPVSTLLVDRRGSIWAETPDGLARYEDGFWRTPAQCGPGTGQVLDMAQDEQGTLWVLTSQGLYRHSRGQWQALPEAAELAPGVPVRFVLEPAGRLWYVSESGLALHDGGRWSAVDMTGLGEQLTLRALVAAGGRLWLATDQGLYETQGGPWKPATEALSAADVRWLEGSVDGDVWAASDGAIAHYSEHHWEVFLAGADLPDVPLTALIRSSDSTVWVGTAGAGLWHHNERGWSQFTSLHGLAHNHVNGIVEAGGALWVATPHGLARYQPQP